MKPEFLQKTQARDIAGLLQKVLINYGLQRNQVEEIEYKALFKGPEEKHAAFRLIDMGGNTNFAVFVFPEH